MVGLQKKQDLTLFGKEWRKSLEDWSLDLWCYSIVSWFNPLWNIFNNFNPLCQVQSMLKSLEGGGVEDMETTPDTSVPPSRGQLFGLVSVIRKQWV